MPADCSYCLHTQLAQYKHTINVHGSVAALKYLALKIPNLSETEKLEFSSYFGTTPEEDEREAPRAEAESCIAEWVEGNLH